MHIIATCSGLYIRDLGASRCTSHSNTDARPRELPSKRICYLMKRKFWATIQGSWPPKPPEALNPKRGIQGGPEGTLKGTPSPTKNQTGGAS